MSTRWFQRVVPALVLAGTVALAGCGDDRKSGPGVLEGTVDASSWTRQPAAPIGAVVLMVEGTGVEKISGSGETRAFVGPASGGTRRVVLVGADRGQLTFDLEVQDVSVRPTVVVESAVDTSNQDVAVLGAVDVRLLAR